jgi:octaprenyl-diphosphate synthase
LSAVDSLLNLVKEDMDRVKDMLLSSASSEVSILEDICSHILSSGGKRLRPLILLLSANACGYKGDQHIPLACVIEYIHTATLLHDDVIDHAEIRRGNSSANKLWGNQSTILAGDFFFSKAFSIAVETGDIKALKVISTAAKLIAEGETFQVSKTDDPMISEDDYIYIVKNKTAILLAAASKIGGILGKVSEEKEKALEDYGLNIGIAFQIMDDVMDYYSNEDDFGKTIGKDFKEGSITLPFIAALNKSSSEDKKKLIEVMQNEKRDDKELADVINLIDKYQGNAYAVNKAKQYVKKAIDALEVITDQDKKEPLIKLAGYIMERKS